MAHMSNHRQQAIAHLASAKAAALALRDAYGQPRHDRAHIADLNAEIGRGLKIAEIEATLAVAEAIEKGRATGVTM